MQGSHVLNARRTLALCHDKAVHALDAAWPAPLGGQAFLSALRLGFGPSELMTALRVGPLSTLIQSRRAGLWFAVVKERRDNPP